MSVLFYFKYITHFTTWLMINTRSKWWSKQNGEHYLSAIACIEAHGIYTRFGLDFCDFYEIIKVHVHVIHYSCIMQQPQCHEEYYQNRPVPLQWCHNGCDSVSNHQPRDCLLNRLFRSTSKKTSKLRVTGLSAGNWPRTGEFPAQTASYAENVSIWWRHHAKPKRDAAKREPCT